jgi:hypothetical protein
MLVSTSRENDVGRTAVALFVAGALCASIASAAPATKIIYRGATLIDGSGAAPRANVDILVDGEKIAAIAAAGKLDPALVAGSTEVAVQGQFVLPGLIDSHVHYATDPDRAAAEAHLKRDVYSGLTGVRDMAGDARALGELARASLVGEIAAPDIFYSALVAGPSFFQDPRTLAAARGTIPGQVPWLYAVDDKTDLALAVAQARGTGAAGMKVYANVPGPLVRGLVAEARRQHFPIWSHLQVYPATPYDSLGANAVSHVCMLARYVREPGKAQYGHANEPSYAGLTPDDPEIRKYTAALLKSGTAIDVTLSVYNRPLDPKRTAAPPCTVALAGAIAGAMHKAGIAIVAGTDVDAAPGDIFPMLHKELVLLVKHAGMTPMEAIVAATRNAARVLQKDDEIGTISAGKLANMVFLREDPSKDIDKLRSVIMTVKRGKQYLRADYKHVASELK